MATPLARDTRGFEPEELPADFTGRRGVKPWATDPDLAVRLWTMSKAWTGVTFAR